MPGALDGLTHTQAAAVSHPAGPLLVVAGAGTGKTRTLTSRFVWLVEQGAPPGELLALTFSSAAAAEMRERLETLIDVPYEELRVSTFHSLCARLLREEALELGIDPYFTTVTPADRVALLHDHIGELSLRRHEIVGNSAALLASFVTRIDRLKDEMVSAEDCLARARERLDGVIEEGARTPAERDLEFAQLYVDHDRLLAAAGAADFGDLVLGAVRLLRERPHVRERLGDRFRHLLVDEYQDTNAAQRALVRLLAGAHGNVTAVGDADQAIYRFRGASRESLREFERDYPGARVVELTENHRSGERILAAAQAIVVDGAARAGQLRGRPGGEVRFWRCRSERAQAQAVAAEAERLIVRVGVEPADICVLVRSVRREGRLVADVLEERGVPARLAGAAAYYERAEVRDALAWLRTLADPTDSAAAVRVLARAPVELGAVDIARLTQLARRRRLDMVSAVMSASEGPQLSPEGREHAARFVKLHRAAARAFETMRPDVFVRRLIERIGLRQRQLLGAEADTAERLVNIAKLGDLASAYARRQPDATARDFTRYLTAVAEAGMREEEATVPGSRGAVSIRTMHGAKGLEFEHVFVLGLSATRMPGTHRGSPDPLLRPGIAAEPETEPRPGARTPADAAAPPPSGWGDHLDEHAAHDQEMRCLLHVAMTRAREGLVLSFAEAGERGTRARPSPFYEEAREAVGVEEELFEEALFGPAEGLHSTLRELREEVLEAVARVGGRLGDMRLDAHLDVVQASARHLELIKLTALIQRAGDGRSLAEVLPEINELVLQGAAPEQRRAFLGSGLDEHLLAVEREEHQRAHAIEGRFEPSLESFIPRRGDGLMLSASDIETYRVCPLKYKFARVYRIPQEPTARQRFGIAIHQVLERFHAGGDRSLEHLRALLREGWRPAGLADSNEELQLWDKAQGALERYWRSDRDRAGEPVWFERSFAFKLGPHLLRGRVDRVDRLPDGGYELVDYKTGKPKTAAELREDVQLSLYQMGAREAWQLETSAQSYFYVLDDERVPVEHSERELERVRATIAAIAAGILAQDFEPTPSYPICSVCDYRIICPAAEK